MPVSLSNMRELLLPGLYEISSSYSGLAQSFDETKGMVAATVFSGEEALSVSLPVAAAMGAAAVLIKNPTVSRRFLEWIK